MNGILLWGSDFNRDVVVTDNVVGDLGDGLVLEKSTGADPPRLWIDVPRNPNDTSLLLYYMHCNILQA